MRPLQTLAFVLPCVLMTQAVGAAPDHPDIGSELKLIESTEAAFDPLGIDPEVGSELDRAAAKLEPASKPPPPVRIGAALSAIEPVSERSHALRMRWEGGLMHVDAQIVLGSTSTLPASIDYRLPVPADSVLVRARICAGPVCRDAGGPLPAAAGNLSLRTTRIEDLRGPALAVSAAPVVKGQDLRIELGYVARAEVHGGFVTFSVPARGEDPRLAPAEVALTAAPGIDFSASLPGEHTAFDDHVWPIALRGELRRAVQTLTSERCGQSTCTRSHAATPFRAAPMRETWLWLDASPSMEGDARNRADRVLATLLASLPESTPLKVAAFAAKHRDVGRFQAGEVPLRTLSDALLYDLGASSRIHGLVQASLAEITRSAPRILLVSDGALDPSDGGLGALDAARARGADVWLLNVGGTARGTSVNEISLADADRLGDEALADLLRRVHARREGRGVAGEGVAVERAPKTPAPAPRAPWLWSWLAREPAADFTISGSPHADQAAAPLASAPYLSVAKPPPPELTGMPKESVLSMLRSQLVPRARACLRSDRRGRPDYAVQLTFEAEFAKREIYDTRVLGEVPRALGACLLALLTELRVPQFSGRVRVRYPIHTERELVPQAEELPTPLVDSVDRALGTPVRTRR